MGAGGTRGTFLLMAVTLSPVTHHPTPNTQHPSPNTQHPSPRCLKGAVVQCQHGQALLDFIGRALHDDVAARVLRAARPEPLGSECLSEQAETDVLGDDAPYDLQGTAHGHELARLTPYRLTEEHIHNLLLDVRRLELSAVPRPSSRRTRRSPVSCTPSAP